MPQTARLYNSSSSSPQLPSSGIDDEGDSSDDAAQLDGGPPGKYAVQDDRAGISLPAAPSFGIANSTGGGGGALANPNLLHEGLESSGQPADAFNGGLLSHEINETRTSGDTRTPLSSITNTTNSGSPASNKQGDAVVLTPNGSSSPAAPGTGSGDCARSLLCGGTDGLPSGPLMPDGNGQPPLYGGSDGLPGSKAGGGTQAPLYGGANTLWSTPGAARVSCQGALHGHLDSACAAAGLPILRAPEDDCRGLKRPRLLATAPDAQDEGRVTSPMRAAKTLKPADGLSAGAAGRWDAAAVGDNNDVSIADSETLEVLQALYALKKQAVMSRG